MLIGLTVTTRNNGIRSDPSNSEHKGAPNYGGSSNVQFQEVIVFAISFVKTSYKFGKSLKRKVLIKQALYNNSIRIKF